MSHYQHRKYHCRDKMVLRSLQNKEICHWTLPMSPQNESYVFKWPFQPTGVEVPYQGQFCTSATKTPYHHIGVEILQIRLKIVECSTFLDKGYLKPWWVQTKKEIHGVIQLTLVNLFISSNVIICFYGCYISFVYFLQNHMFSQIFPPPFFNLLKPSDAYVCR